MTQQTPASDRFRAVIIGAGVAALEAALALHERAGERVATTILAPNRDFVYRPLSVREPFARAGAVRYPLAPLLASAGARQISSSLRWIDDGAHVLHSTDGETIPYDAALIAIGARPYTRYPRSITVDPARLDDQLHGIIQDVELGLIRSLAFVIPPGRSWPLPAYELALMTAKRADEMGARPAITLLTPEPSPLAVFGAAASAAVGEALAQAGIELITGAAAHIRVSGRITVRGRDGELVADRVVALPELRGPSIAGVPSSGLQGFIWTDTHGRVRNMEHVFAAGDITSYPVKQGSIAAQQGVAVAEEIAGLAGVDTVAAPFEPFIHGILLGPDQPLYMRARLVGGWPASSEVSTTPLWEEADKIHAPYLTTALAGIGDGAPSVSKLASI